MKTYKSNIETALISSDDNLNTYEIVKRIEDANGECGYIISLYPTRNSDNINASDNTLNHLVAHMQELGFNELHVLNLFSKVVSGKMSSRGLQIDSANMQYIENVMKDKKFKNSKFIVAWGNSMLSSHACSSSKAEIFKMFKANCPDGKIYQLTTMNRKLDCGIAPHPLFLGIRASNAVWGLQEFKITDKMISDLNAVKTTEISKKQKT